MDYHYEFYVASRVHSDNKGTILHIHAY